MLMRLRKAMGWNHNKQIYEMSFGNGKWYNIHRDRMRLDGSTRQQQNLFNALLAGVIAVVTGNYSRTKQQLRLTL